MSDNEDKSREVRTLLIVDPARRFGSSRDRLFSDRLARAFHRRGWVVAWAVDTDDSLPTRPYATVYRILPSSSIKPGLHAVAKEDDQPLTCSPSEEPDAVRHGDMAADDSWVARLFCWARTTWKTKALWVLKARKVGAIEMAREHDIDFVDLVRRCKDDDLIVFPAAETVHLEMLLELLPKLEIAAPLPTTLHMRFATVPRLRINRGELGIETIAARLASGSPVRSLVFHADSVADATNYARAIKMPVAVLGEGAEGAGDGLPDEALLDCFFCHQPAGEARIQKSAVSLVVDRFGPMALIVSALWGRVGSSVVFEAQTRYLIDCGYIVVRVLIDHWTMQAESRAQCRATLLGEEFEHVRPHVHFIGSRNGAPQYVARLAAEQEFQTASPVRRIQLLLAEPCFEEPRALNYCGTHAALAIVNHLGNLAFTERLTAAPIILETHDISSHLLNTHGIPVFVPKGPDTEDLRVQEERDAWSRVAACVNLSPEDHEIISQSAKRSMLVRPYVPKRRAARSWPEVFVANKLDPAFREMNLFDLMLWGSDHKANARSVTWFLKEVVTAHDALRRSRILLVGRVCNELDQELLQRGNVLVAGPVDRFEDFADRTSILVIPDQCGTGISIKAMDAFALGACFATTRCGIRGIDIGGTGYVPTTDAEALGADITRLLGSMSARTERAALARKLYELNFSAEAYARGWNTIIAAVASETPQQTASPGAHLAASPRPAPLLPPQLVPAKKSGKRAAPDKPQRPRLTVVVCTYDRYHVLPDVLRSLLSQDCPPGFLEVMVVDNSPNQAAAAEFAARYAQESRIRYVLESAPGLSNARNAGREKARANLVAFVDDDAIAAPDWAQEIVRAFDAYGNRAGVVGGRVVPRWVTTKPTWLPQSLLGCLSIIDWGGDLRELNSTEWLAGCNIAFDKGVLTAIGGFSRALGRTGAGGALLSSEEIEVMQRIRAAGRLCIYAPAASVEHVINEDRLTQTWFRSRAAWQAVSEFIINPKKALDYAPTAAEHLRGFYRATEDVDEFKQQVGLAYDIVISMLSGGVELDDGWKPAEIERSKLQRDNLIAQCQEIAANRDALLNSTSWRVTAPLRIVVNQVRRLLERFPS